MENIIDLTKHLITLKLEELHKELISLEQEKFRIECADNFAYSNGRIGMINDEIRAVRNDILVWRERAYE